MHKVVIPVAGLGTRFWPATTVMPKEMLPLVDRPIIEYGVAEARNAGLLDILLVSSRHKRAIEDHFDVPPDVAAAAERKGIQLDQHPDVRFHFVRQNRPGGLGQAVALASAHVNGEPFAVLLPDDVLAGPPCCLEEMVRIYEETHRPVIAVRRVSPSEVSSYGVIATSTRRGPLYDVTDLVEKPAPEDAPTNLAVVGRYVLPSALFGFLQHQGAGANGEIQLTDALRQLNRSVPFIAYEFPGRVFDTGSKIGFLQATVELALEHPQLGEQFRGYIQEVAQRASLEARAR